MKKYYLVAVLFSLAYVAWGQQVRLLNEEDKEPVVSAAVMDKFGTIVGYSDEKGVLPQAADELDTVSVQHMAFHPYTFAMPKGKNLAVLLKPVQMSVPEVTIGASKRLDYIRLTGFFRSFMTADTMGINARKKRTRQRGYADMTYTEGKAELYFRAKDGAQETYGYGPLQLRKYANSKEGKGSFTIVGNDLGTELCLNLLTLEDMLPMLDESLQKKEKEVEVRSKDGSLHVGVIRFDSPRRVVSIDYDDIAQRNGKPHSYLTALRLLGLRFSIPELRISAQLHWPREQFRMTNVMNMQGNAGVLFSYKKRTEVNMNFHSEFYVTEVEYLSKEEYKAVKKRLEKSDHKISAEGFSKPEGTPALPIPVQEALRLMK